MFSRKGKETLQGTKVGREDRTGFSKFPAGRRSKELPSRSGASQESGKKKGTFFISHKKKEGMKKQAGGGGQKKKGFNRAKPGKRKARVSSL